MKYWILPTILEWFGLIGAIIMVITAYEFRELNVELMIALMAIAIALMAVMNTIAQQERNTHFKRILKKHGLWQDEIIKKKDLPKDK